MLFRYVLARDVCAGYIPGVATSVAIGSDVLNYCAHVREAVAVA